MKIGVDMYDQMASDRWQSFGGCCEFVSSVCVRVCYLSAYNNENDFLNILNIEYSIIIFLFVTKIIFGKKFLYVINNKHYFLRNENKNIFVLKKRIEKEISFHLEKENNFFYFF